MFKKLKILLKIANQIYGIVKELSKKVEAKETIIEKSIIIHFLRAKN